MNETKPSAVESENQGIPPRALYPELSRLQSEKRYLRYLTRGPFL